MRLPNSKKPDFSRAYSKANEILVKSSAIQTFPFAKHEILVGKNKWVSKKEWQAAIRARKNGAETKEQKEMLDNGHWKPKK